MRTFFLIVMLAVAGCGDDSTQAPAPDMSMRLDLSGQPTSCSSTGVAQSCANASGNAGCFVCNLSGGAGVCARVCSLVTQGCPSGQTCHEFSFADGGVSSSIATEGSSCAGLGYCQ